jgi:hypothetical protein
VKAKASPMTPIKNHMPGTTEEIAVRLAKRVVANAVEAGMPDDEVQAMRARMLKWLGIIKAFEVDRFEIRTDEKMERSQRLELLSTMDEQLNKAREEIFGE